MSYTAPWARNYTSESNPVPQDVVLPWLEEPVVTNPSVVPVVPPVSAPGSITIPGLPSDLRSAWDQAITEAETAAVAAVRSRVIAALQAEVPEPPAITLEPQDVTNAAARGRALRSLVYGLGLTIFWALVTAIGDAVSGGTIDFFTKTGWISVATLAVGTIAHAALSYLGRIRFAPNSPE
jgi:hypothetical protein